MDEIPPLPGSYALFLTLLSPAAVKAGGLGVFSFLAGEYIYFGSAWGPGGLRVRIQHHLRQSARPHWHLDYLRRFAVVRAIFYSPALASADCPGPAALPLECLWSSVLSRFSGASAPVKGFGASDCRSGCPAHLFLLPSGAGDNEILNVLRFAGESGQEIAGFFVPVVERAAGSSF